MLDRNAPTIIVVCVVHQSPANTKELLVPKPIDTTAQWRLVTINDKVTIVKQSNMLNKPYQFVLQLKFKITKVMAMHVWSELIFPQQSYCESLAVKSFKWLPCRFTGRKEAGSNENSSYYILTQCEDGAFEAVPVNNWYSFTADIKYQTLTADEAEEEFNRPERTVNYFSLMIKKRLADNKDDMEEGGHNGMDKSSKIASRTANW